MSEKPQSLSQKYSNVVAILWKKLKVSCVEDISKIFYSVDRVCMNCGWRDDKNPRQHRPCGQCGYTRGDEDTEPIGALGPYTP